MFVEAKVNHAHTENVAQIFSQGGGNFPNQEELTFLKLNENMVLK